MTEAATPACSLHSLMIQFLEALLYFFVCATLYKHMVDFYTEVKMHSSTFLDKQDCYLNVTWMSHIIKLALENRAATS